MQCEGRARGEFFGLSLTTGTAPASFISQQEAEKKRLQAAQEEEYQQHFVERLRVVRLAGSTK